jgi:hypothetical protein
MRKFVANIISHCTVRSDVSLLAGVNEGIARGLAELGCAPFIFTPASNSASNVEVVAYIGMPNMETMLALLGIITTSSSGHDKPCEQPLQPMVEALVADTVFRQNARCNIPSELCRLLHDFTSRMCDNGCGTASYHGNLIGGLSN